ncbi:MAG: CBS domain-containing protein [Pseudonocardia sp.]
MKVEQILESKGRSVEIVHPWVTVVEAVRRLAGPPRIGALVVCGGPERRVLGMLTERDVVAALGVDGPELLARTVEEVMSRNVPTCSPEDSLPQLMAQMTRSRYRHVPVVAAGRLVGLVSIGDAVKHRLREMELETGVLRDLYHAGR